MLVNGGELRRDVPHALGQLLCCGLPVLARGQGVRLADAGWGRQLTLLRLGVLPLSPRPSLPLLLRCLHVHIEVIVVDERPQRWRWPCGRSKGEDHSSLEAS